MDIMHVCKVDLEYKSQHKRLQDPNEGLDHEKRSTTTTRLLHEMTSQKAYGVLLGVGAFSRDFPFVWLWAWGLGLGMALSFSIHLLSIPAMPMAALIGLLFYSRDRLYARVLDFFFLDCRHIHGRVLHHSK
jgi:hypothetical protein